MLANLALFVRKLFETPWRPPNLALLVQNYMATLNRDTVCCGQSACNTTASAIEANRRHPLKVEWPQNSRWKGRRELEFPSPAPFEPGLDGRGSRADQSVRPGVRPIYESAAAVKHFFLLVFCFWRPSGRLLSEITIHYS